MNPSGEWVLVGAGGHAKVVAAAALACGGTVRAVYDDDPAKWGGRLLGIPIVGAMTAAEAAGLPALMGVGDNRARARLVELLRLDWATVVHPTAWVHDSVTLGAGSVVFAGAVVQPDTRIGEHVIVNTAASIDHDGCIGSFAHIAPGVHLSGGVSVGEGALLGVGSCARPGASVGAWAIVGAGAAIVGAIPDGVTAVGVPARVVGGAGR